MAHPADDEQGFQLRTAGTRRREPIDLNGLALIAFHREGREMANPF
ncbi:type I-E CRISPR-associated endoribonuclease Cas2 [Streptomyces anulatus]